MATSIPTVLTPEWPPTQSAIFFTLAVGVVMTLATLLRPSKSKAGVHNLGGIPVFTAWTFFTKRYDFLRKHFNSGKKYFQFRVLQHRVIALSGEEARKMFFVEQGLSLGEGYRILMGAAPYLEDINVKPEDGEIQDGDFVKRLLLLMHKDRILDVLPALFEDVNRRMKDWGNEGRINPFKEIYDLVFQMTVRMATCQELAENKDDIERLTQHYWDLEKSATPVALLLPWFPSRAKKAQKNSTRALFTLLYKYVDLRRKAPVPSSDPIDTLIAYGDNNEAIVGFIMGVIFAGVINTGAKSCWILLNLGANPEWKSKVTEELKTLVTNHTNTLSKEPLHKRLAAIPLSAWEEELPALDLVIRETIRIAASGAALRRNLGKDILLADTTIKRGDFLTYSLSDVHLNANIYADPTKFDPGRFTKGKEDNQKETYTYLGWGVGRHPCAGMRIAKLEMKLILAMFLVGYEYELVDSRGNFPKELPLQDRNDIQQSRPLGDPCYLKFKRVTD